MKLCTKCQKNPRAEGQTWCRECFRDYKRMWQREWGKKNPEKVKAHNKAQYQKHREKRLVEACVYRKKNEKQIRSKREALRAEKRVHVLAAKDRPCLDCGVRFPPIAMDFDHVRGIKKDDVARMAAGPQSVQVLLDEIAKCEVVCAICHRIRTENRRKETPCSTSILT